MLTSNVLSYFFYIPIHSEPTLGIDLRSLKNTGSNMLSSVVPVFDFDRLKPVTMTVIVSYDVGELNLPGLFMFLPVTERVLPGNLTVQKKQGKIRLPPELNVPGEILSMRFDKQVRGIVRSENAKSFPHLIIIDIGTSERIISIKLSRTMELTGPTSIALAREAAQALLNHCRNCQETIVFVRENRSRARQIRDDFVSAYLTDAVQSGPDDEVGRRLWEIFTRQTRGYSKETVGHFLDRLIDFDRNLITGSLKLNTFESEMANILFNLGYPINQVSFARVMDSPPFRTSFNNYKSASAVIVYYDYMKYDRNTGNMKQAKHTIRVNKSGHVRHSGNNLESMKAVYYAFMQRTLMYAQEVQSVEAGRQYLRLSHPPKVYTIHEWHDILRKEYDLYQKIVNSEVPIAKADQSPPQEEEPTITLEILEQGQRAIDVHEMATEAPVMEFGYSPMFRY